MTTPWGVMVRVVVTGRLMSIEARPNRSPLKIGRTFVAEQAYVPSPSSLRVQVPEPVREKLKVLVSPS